MHSSYNVRFANISERWCHRTVCVLKKSVGANIFEDFKHENIQKFIRIVHTKSLKQYYDDANRRIPIVSIQE